MQKWIAMGRTTKDVEIRYDGNGKPVVRFDFAVNRRFKREGEAEADFFSCVAFNSAADGLAKCNVIKGTKLLITGEVRNNNYTNRDGQKVYGTQIVVESFEFCESKGTAQSSTPAAQTDSDGFMSIPDGLEDELPFN